MRNIWTDLITEAVEEGGDAAGGRPGAAGGAAAKSLGEAEAGLPGETKQP